MKLWYRLLVVSGAALTVLACSEKTGEREKTEGAIPQHQLEALNKAKAVEETLNEADTTRRAQADKDIGIEPEG